MMDNRDNRDNRDNDDGRKDFDFWFGDWKVHNRRLRRRLANDTVWQEFEAKAKAWPLLGGIGNVDAFHAAAFPTDGKPLHGASFRTFNPGTRLWSIYWADDRTFDLQPAVHGRFENGRGEFLGDDTFEGRKIRVRYVWSHITPSSARWDQSFSPDGGETWETNWYMTMTRDT